MLNTSTKIFRIFEVLLVCLVVLFQFAREANYWLWLAIVMRVAHFPRRGPLPRHIRFINRPKAPRQRYFQAFLALWRVDGGAN